MRNELKNLLDGTKESNRKIGEEVEQGIYQIAPPALRTFLLMDEEGKVLKELISLMLKKLYTIDEVVQLGGGLLYFDTEKKANEIMAMKHDLQSLLVEAFSMELISFSKIGYAVAYADSNVKGISVGLQIVKP